MNLTSKESVVIDSQILVYACDNDSKFHDLAKHIFSLVAQKSIHGVVAQQNILEAERILIQRYKQPIRPVVATLETMISEFSLRIINPAPTTYRRFHRLIESGKPTADFFDYYLAATMLDNGITHIVTGNTKDFASIQGITIIDLSTITSFSHSFATLTI